MDVARACRENMAVGDHKFSRRRNAVEICLISAPCGRRACCAWLAWPAVIVPTLGIITLGPASFPGRQTFENCSLSFDLPKEREFLSVASLFNHKEKRPLCLPLVYLRLFPGRAAYYLGIESRNICRNGLEHEMWIDLFAVAAEVACPIVLLLASPIMF